MTNQEAISIIEENVIGSGCTDFIYEALQLAIKSLKNAENDDLALDFAQSSQNHALNMQKSNTLVLKLVETQSVTDAIDRYIDKFDGVDKNFLDGFGTAAKIIEQLLSTQPEIIRCRDCKFWREHKYAKETKRYIPFCGLNAIYTKSDDFCSRAKRRKDEGYET